MTQEIVKNVLGEEIEIFVGWKWSSRYAWNSKFFTENCSQCPWCMGKGGSHSNYSKGKCF